LLLSINCDPNISYYGNEMISESGSTARTPDRIIHLILELWGLML